MGDEERGLYRRAMGLLLLGSAGVVAFCVQLGIPALVTLGVFTLYFLVVLTLARLRAEAGPAWAFGPDRSPHQLLVWMLGSTAFDRQTLVSLGLLNFFFADVRFATLPSYMESLKTAHEARIPFRQMIWVILVATVAAIAFGCYAATHTYYDLGAATAKVYGSAQWIGRTSCNLPIQWLTFRTNPDWQRLGMMLVGGLVVVALHVARQRVLWWPFHPVGYVMAHTGAGYSFVCHYFLAWAAKTIILRVGGNRLYRQSLPFVIGLILGDIVTQTMWSLVASLAGWPVYQFIS